MISISNLTKTYGHTRVFHQFNAEFSSDRVCLRAPNGSGKTTLLMILAGLESAGRGEILYDGERLDDPRSRVALASDKITVPEFLTLRQMLQLTAGCWKCQWPEGLIRELMLEPFLETRWPALSSGNRQKARLVAAMMRKCPYLLLDEPGNALDDKSHQALVGMLDAYPGQVVITSHTASFYAEQGFAVTDLNP